MAFEQQEKEKQRAHELKLAKIQVFSPAPAAAPTAEGRIFPKFHLNDCIIACLDTFKETYSDYKIPVEDYTRTLRAYAQGPLLEVLAELQDSDTQDFTKFEQLVHATFALTQEHTRICFCKGANGQKEAF